MSTRRIVTLLTDFGLGGPYVAALKGTILSVAPETVLVDVSHSVSPQNILEGAFVLAGIFHEFPEGTVHLAVVDPGVGTDRRLLAVSANRQWFVLPDNGLITGVTRSATIDEVRLLTNPKLRRPRVSRTFHGRDILAPAAAFLAGGGNPSELGPACDPASVVRLDLLDPAEDDRGLIGEVVYRDSFGNLVTNVPGDRLADARWSLVIKGRTIRDFVKTYAERPTGTLVFLEGSSGWIEVAEVNGDAAGRLDAGSGTTIRLIKESTT